MTKQLINKELKIIEKLIQDNNVSREYIIMRMKEFLNYITYLYQKEALSTHTFNEKFNKLSDLITTLNIVKRPIENYEQSLKKHDLLAKYYLEAFNKKGVNKND